MRQFNVTRKGAARSLRAYMQCVTTRLVEYKFSNFSVKFSEAFKGSRGTVPTNRSSIVDMASHHKSPGPIKYWRDNASIIQRWRDTNRAPSFVWSRAKPRPAGSVNSLCSKRCKSRYTKQLRVIRQKVWSVVIPKPTYHPKFFSDIDFRGPASLRWGTCPRAVWLCR